VSDGKNCDDGTHTVTLSINEGTANRRVTARCQTCSCVWTLDIRIVHHPTMAEDLTPSKPRARSPISRKSVVGRPAPSPAKR
jgi:hypothetical protein